VAGTIGAVGNNDLGVTGVNWHVQIMALKAFTAGGSGARSAILSALNYAVMMKNRGVNIKLTSNSYGSILPFPSQAMEDAIAATRDAGMLFVAGAGNSNRNAAVWPSYPAAYDLDNIISVAASDRNDAKASFSNYGAISVDLAAPGVDILSTFPTQATTLMISRGFSPSYGTISGTSMATPHVAGVAASSLEGGPLTFSF
jgi:subtilisin family serine protease